MAIYRNISIGFWSDSKVYEELEIEERYLFLYLLTNTHTNICGCYEVGVRQAMNETGMTKAALQKAINGLDRTHNMIRYNPENNEVLILNWSKYNWSSSEKLVGAVKKEIARVKTDAFRDYLNALVNGDTPTDRGTGLDNTPTDTTVSVSVTDTVPDTVTESVTDTATEQHTGTYSNDPMVDAAIKDFIKYRKEMKKPMGDIAVNRFLSRLAKLSTDPQEQVDLINTAIEHGWQTVYEPKEQSRSGTPPDKYALIDAWARGEA